jgi:hypothetical protein
MCAGRRNTNWHMRRSPQYELTCAQEAAIQIDINAREAAIQIDINAQEAAIRYLGQHGECGEQDGD